MAKGDTTITKNFTSKPGWAGEKKAYFTLTFDDNYITGGSDFDLTVYGLGTLLYVGLPPTVAGLVPEWDATNKTIKLYYADYDAVADGALIEVPDNDATCKTKSFKFFVVGVGV